MESISTEKSQLSVLFDSDRDSDVDGEEDGNIKQPWVPIAKEKNKSSKGKASSKRSSANNNKKGKKRKLSDASVEGVEQVDGTLAEVTPEEPSVKISALDVPPHWRSVITNELDEYTQFRRLARGLLNNLCKSNLKSITREVSTAIVSMASHIDASQIVRQMILESCSRGNEQFASVFAAFAAGISCSVGKDFSAEFLASLAKLFEDEYQKENNPSLLNLTLLLSYLCIFGICASDLIYDFLILLAKRLTEVDFSTIQTILQCCGMKLRGDDPAAMKDFILSIQNRVNELKSSYMVDDHPRIHYRRMEFMLQNIRCIKKSMKKSKEDSRSHTSIKKWLQKLNVENAALHRGLQWSRLIDPSKKGQWWLSGETTSSRDDVEEGFLLFAANDVVGGLPASCNISNVPGSA